MKRPSEFMSAIFLPNTSLLYNIPICCASNYFCNKGSITFLSSATNNWEKFTDSSYSHQENQLENFVSELD